MASRVCAKKRVRVACIIQDRAFGRMGETADKVIFGEDGREVMNVDLVRLRHRLLFLFLLFSCFIRRRFAVLTSRIRVESGSDGNWQRAEWGGHGRRSGGVIGLIRHGNRADVNDDYRRATPSAPNHGCAWHFRFLASSGVQVAFLQPDNQQKPHHV